MKISFKCREQVGQPCWKRYYIGDGIAHTVTSIRNRKSMKISALQILRNFCFGIMSFMNILKIQLISHFKQVIRIMLLSNSFCYDQNMDWEQFNWTCFSLTYIYIYMIIEIDNFMIKDEDVQRIKETRNVQFYTSTGKVLKIGRTRSIIASCFQLCCFLLYRILSSIYCVQTQ